MTAAIVIAVAIAVASLKDLCKSLRKDTGYLIEFVIIVYGCEDLLAVLLDNLQNYEIAVVIKEIIILIIVL